MRTMALIDTTNLYKCVQNKFGEDARIDYNKLKEFLIANGLAARLEAHGNDPKDKGIPFRDALKHQGYQTKFIKAPDHRKNCSMEIVVSCLDAMPDVDRFVLVTADYQLGSFVLWLRTQEKYVWVIGAGITRELKNTASQFTEITEAMLEKKDA